MRSSSCFNSDDVVFSLKSSNSKMNRQDTNPWVGLTGLKLRLKYSLLTPIGVLVCYSGWCTACCLLSICFCVLLYDASPFGDRAEVLFYYRLGYQPNGLAGPSYPTWGFIVTLQNPPLVSNVKQAGHPWLDVFVTSSKWETNAVKRNLETMKEQSPQLFTSS